LGNGLAFFPVTQKLTVGGPLDGLHGSGFNGLGSLFIQRLACHIGGAARSHDVVDAVMRSTLTRFLSWKEALTISAVSLS
jgi:hypothetical protein